MAAFNTDCTIFVSIPLYSAPIPSSLIMDERVEEEKDVTFGEDGVRRMILPPVFLAVLQLPHQ